MAKQHVAEQETLGEAMNKTEFFFEKNGRMLSYVFLGLLVLAALVFGYRALIVSPRAEKAAEMIAEAQYRFEDQNADYALALEGDANGAGFLEVIEKYGSTPSGNLAKPEGRRPGECCQIPGQVFARKGYPGRIDQRPELRVAG